MYRNLQKLLREAPGRINGRAIAARRSATACTGLLNIPALESESEFLRSSNHVLRTCKQFRQNLQLHRNDPCVQRKAVHLLDLLSDSLCSVIDTAGLLRAVHPSEGFCQTADFIYNQFAYYLNELNNDVDLYQFLKDATSTTTISSTWGPVENRVATLLLTEFSKNAIHLSPQERERCVRLHAAITRYSQQIQQYFMNPAHPPVEIPRGLLNIAMDEYPPGPDRSFVERMVERSPFGNPRLHLNSLTIDFVMKYVADSSLRKQVLLRAGRVGPEYMELFENVFLKRYQLARLVGSNSYADLYLTEDKMCRNQGQVIAFLGNIAKRNRPDYESVVHEMERRKGVMEGDSKIYEWDRRFYRRLIAMRGQDMADIESKAPSLEKVLEIIGQLAKRLFDVNMKETPPAKSEVWNHKVRRLDFSDGHGNPLGTIYVDVLAGYSRAPSNGCHFTVQCSKAHLKSETLPPWVDWDSMMLFHPPTHHLTKHGRTQQLPIVVVHCDFPAEENMSWPDVETLFHEMGHGLHSMLSQGEFQHVSGTRCPIDLAEIPSTIFEHFAYIPAVWSSLPGTEPPPRQQCPIRTHRQVGLSLLDQALHSEHLQDFRSSGSDDFPSTQIYRLCQEAPQSLWPGLEAATSLIPVPDGVHEQIRFRHTVSDYGAGYYSYLWSNEIAKLILRRLFRDPRRWSESGVLLREELLRWGGGRDPMLCVRGVLGDKDMELLTARL